MTIAVAVVTLLLLAAVLILIGSPLRARTGAHDAAAGAVEAERRREESARRLRDQLEAAREAKYREIRDAELDFRTGKLSQQDYAAVDRALRGEASEILRRLDEIDAQ